MADSSFFLFIFLAWLGHNWLGGNWPFPGLFGRDWVGGGGEVIRQSRTAHIRELVREEIYSRYARIHTHDIQMRREEGSILVMHARCAVDMEYGYAMSQPTDGRTSMGV